jgi:hypothetical protein
MWHCEQAIDVVKKLPSDELCALPGTLKARELGFQYVLHLFLQQRHRNRLYSELSEGVLLLPCVTLCVAPESSNLS